MDKRRRPFYWSAENSIGEIDFLIQDAGCVIAIEVKAEENLRSKSLRAFKEKNREAFAIRFSLSPFRKQDWMRNVPLYAMANKQLWGANDNADSLRFTFCSLPESNGEASL